MVDVAVHRENQVKEKLRDLELSQELLPSDLPGVHANGRLSVVSVEKNVDQRV